MKTLKITIIVLCSLLLFSSCNTQKLLQETTLVQNQPIEGYKYIYVQPSSTISSNIGYVGGTAYGVYGASSNRSVNPNDVISGFLIKKGYIKLPEITPNLASQTLIINYGELGLRKLNALAYATKIIIQIISAETNEVLCTSEAEGCGETKSDDI